MGFGRVIQEDLSFAQWMVCISTSVSCLGVLVVLIRSIRVSMRMYTIFWIGYFKQLKVCIHSVLCEAVFISAFLMVKHILEVNVVQL